MATVNLGSIKFNWKGAYSGVTAYVVDDVVEYNGSSYICILASTGNLPTNATYWEQMSQAGTDGTDLTTTLTTQGDIVYRDASGLARLGAGTSGQVLQTGGTGANPSWADSTGGILSSNQVVYGSRVSTTNTSFIDIYSGVMDITITPQSSSSKFLILWSFAQYGSYAESDIGRDINNTGSFTRLSGGNVHGLGGGYIAGNTWGGSTVTYLDSPNTTNSVKYRPVGRTSNGAYQAIFGDNDDRQVFTIIEF